MEEGFVTILFILLFMAASVIDAVGRKKKRQRRMDEMEAEDAGDEWAQEGQQGRGGPPVAVEDGTDRYRRASAGGESDMERYRRMDTSEPDVTPAAPDPARGQDRDRESAESMVPADLWAILTGQTPEGSAPHPDPGPRIPAPTPGDRMSRSTLEGQPPAAVEEPEAATRRSSRWMEGIEEREVSDRWTAAVEAGEAEVYRQLEEPWGKLEDISKGDLTEVSSPLSMGDDEDSLLPRGRVRGGAGTPYTRLLETGSVDDLRKAVVLKEVLDRPMALRDEIGPLR
ncbi:MAG: hypothetical protein EA422_09100 [Gemmatimonadales bacterium]|nr:MAG: hypothetical protein EA422_09100 [Gemmatimonadales bacterium]